MTDDEDTTVEGISVRSLRKLIREELENAFLKSLKAMPLDVASKKFPDFMKYIKVKAPRGLDDVKFAIASKGFMSKGQPYALFNDSNNTVITWVDGGPKFSSSETISRAIQKVSA